MQRIILTLMLCTLSLVGLHPERLVLAVQEPGNLLQNPSFEGNYFAWSGIPEAQVAHGWTPWWRTRTDADPPAYFFKPEYKQANGYIFPNRVRSGAAAQQWFTFFSTHQAGMYQQVFGVTPGVRYRFTVWAQVWSSSENEPNVSVNPAYPNLQVGIDPTGSWSAWAGSIVWSGTYAFYDSWGQLAVEAVAQNDVITVFLRSEPNFPVKHNDLYWDDAMLVAVGQGPAPAPPTATSIAPPSVTVPPAGPPSPTPTCAPVPTDWVTYYVQRGDTLFSLSKRTGTTVERVVAVNCLETTTIHVDQALHLPMQPATITPTREVATSTAAQPTATTRPSQTPTGAPSATSTPLLPTTVPATATSPLPTETVEPMASATLPPATATQAPAVVPTATSTKPPPTIPPPATSTPGEPVAPPTSTPSSSSTRPCGTIVVGGGIVMLAGIFRFRRRGDLARE